MCLWVDNSYRCPAGVLWEGAVTNRSHGGQWSSVEQIGIKFAYKCVNKLYLLRHLDSVHIMSAIWYAVILVWTRCLTINCLLMVIIYCNITNWATFSINIILLRALNRFNRLSTKKINIIFFMLDCYDEFTKK